MNRDVVAVLYLLIVEIYIYSTQWGEVISEGAFFLHFILDIYLV